MNASEYTEAVEELLRAHGDSNVAGPMAQYMIALDVLEKSKKRLTPDHLPFVVIPWIIWLPKRSNIYHDRVVWRICA
ncbi:hypothetical protein [Brevibacillus porteri]|uniref:hypothetical protein n=1 Tax=Brevibacillus porteri TaxID=2126350 RepID=UPI003D1FC0DD